MSWFNNYLHKRAAWGDEDWQQQHGELPQINWMEMMPNGQRFWQVSLDKAFQRGKQEYGPAWDRADKTTGKIIYPAKEEVFIQWWERVDGPLTGMTNMINDYVESTEHFRPLETQEIAEDTNIDIPSADDLSDWWG